MSEQGNDGVNSWKDLVARGQSGRATAGYGPTQVSEGMTPGIAVVISLAGVLLVVMGVRFSPGPEAPPPRPQPSLASISSPLPPDSPVPQDKPGEIPAVLAQDAPPSPPPGPVVAETDPEKLKRRMLRGSQYVDAGDSRPPGSKVDGTLRNGDFVTVLAYVRQWDFLYFVVIQPSDRIRLSKIFPKPMLHATGSPLKFTVRDKKPGPFQVMLLASQAELPDIQVYIQEANLLQAPRAKRIEKLVATLEKALPPNTWAHTLLPGLPFEP